jgi:carbon monoxide dehydrogenase subunit G
MSKVTYSIEVNKPVEHVFQFLDDSYYATQWISGLQSIEAITEGGNRVGARAKHIYVENGREIEMIEETLVYEPNKRVKFKGVTDGFELTVEYRLVPTAKGTRIEMIEEMHMTSLFMKIISPLIHLSAKRRLADDFARLKALVESQSTFQPVTN